MPVTLQNNANGGTNGAAVSYANAGDASGDVWTFLSYGTGMTISYANAPARGGMAYKCTTTATAAQGFMVWGNFPNSATTYVRFSAYLPSLPAASFRFCELSDNTSIGLSIGCTTAGRLSIRDSPGAQMGLSTTVLPIGRWFRIELMCVSSATTGQMTFRIYTDVDSPHPAETLTSAASFNTKPNAPYIHYPRFGITGLAVANWTYYLDDISYSDAGWLGPAHQSFVPSGSLYNGAEMGTNGTAASIDNTGNSTNSFFDFTTPGTFTYSNAQAAHGSLSYIIQPTAGVGTCTKWTTFATQSAAARMYIYLTALPENTTEFIQLTSHETGTFAFMGRAAISSGGNLVIYDNSGVIWTSTATMSINGWYRIELYGAIGGSSTTGALQAAFYTLDSTTAVDSFTTNTANTGTLQAITGVRFGKVTPTSFASSFYIDDLAAQAQAGGFIGPYTGPLTPPATFSGIIPHLGWGRKV